jgi:hypothetical protein
LSSPSHPHSQLTLKLSSLACDACAYALTGRCKGIDSATVQSFTRGDDSVIGCIDPKRQTDFLVDLYSTWSPRVYKSKHAELLLPRFIPEVLRGLKQAPAFRRNTLFGISLSTIIEENGTLRYKSADQLRKSLKLPLHARLCLVGTANDYSIELFWQKSEVQNAWARIAAFRFEFATSLTFSVWDQQPRFDQIYNLDRNLATHDFLLSQGIASIPFLFFYDETDYKEILAWLRARPDIQRVAMLAHFFEETSDFELLLAEMRMLQRDLGRALNFLVVGPSSADKIDRVLTEFAGSTIVTHQPIMKAIMGYSTLPNLGHVQASKRVGHGKLASNNVQTFQDHCSQPELWN